MKNDAVREELIAHLKNNNINDINIDALLEYADNIAKHVLHALTYADEDSKLGILTTLICSEKISHLF